MADENLRYAREWLAKARNDRLSAQALVSLPAPITDTAAFHCQQAAEKAFKAFLTLHGQPFEKMHDLLRLCKMCENVDRSFASLQDVSVNLTQYAVQFRYPGEGDPTVEDVEEALGNVRDIWTFVLDRLPVAFRETESDT